MQPRLRTAEPGAVWGAMRVPGLELGGCRGSRWPSPRAHRVWPSGALCEPQGDPPRQPSSFPASLCHCDCGPRPPTSLPASVRRGGLLQADPPLCLPGLRGPFLGGAPPERDAPSCPEPYPLAGEQSLCSTPCSLSCVGFFLGLFCEHTVGGGIGSAERSCAQRRERSGPGSAPGGPGSLSSSLKWD